MSVLFVQKRPIRAGAQTSLARLVGSHPIRALDPVVLLNSEGWLAERLKFQKTPHFVIPFKNPRSLFARIFGLASWAESVISRIGNQSSKIRLIVANDHQECPLALAIARALGNLPVLAILRTPGMSQSDFERYNCDACEGLMGEGNELLAQIRNWTSKSVVLFEEGFEEAEFLPLRPRAVVCPSCILVIGSESLRKGFGDFIDALRLFEKRRPDFLGWECHLTGSRTARFAAMLSQTMRSKFTFLGRREDFSELVRQYDFAVHPSRAETFGMAPIESMLAGTPTLISETGIVSELVLPPAWTFPPADVETLSRRLEFLWEFWPPLDFSHVHAQVRNRCHINHTASVVRAEIETIVNRLK